MALSVWCNDCKTIHSTGRHARPQPVPPADALRLLSAMYDDLRRAADVAERRLRQLCDPAEVERDPAAAAGMVAADELRKELDRR